MAVSTLQDDKKKALNLAIAQIEKSCGKGSIMRLGADQKVRVEAISTGAISITWSSISRLGPATRRSVWRSSSP